MPPTSPQHIDRTAPPVPDAHVGADASFGEEAASDVKMLALFQQDPELAWAQFIERYSDFILSNMRRLGFDYDQAMDRYVYICENLCRDNYRRLRMVRYAGSRGDLTPWLRTVIKNLCVNWAWSAEGRKRLFKSIARLPERDQRIFELYFWKGLSPSEIYEEMRSGRQFDIGYIEVLDRLERILSHLSKKKLARLASNLVRRRGSLSLDDPDQVGPTFEPADSRPNPEEVLIQSEVEKRIECALGGLSARERLIVSLRYEEGMGRSAIAEILRIGEPEVSSQLKTAIRKLRRTLK